MDENEKKIKNLIKEQKNLVVIAVALGIQGMILIISGILLEAINAYFGSRIASSSLLLLQIAFFLSGVVNLGMAMHFYRKSRIPTT